MKRRAFLHPSSAALAASSLTPVLASAQPPVRVFSFR